MNCKTPRVLGKYSDLNIKIPDHKASKAKKYQADGEAVSMQSETNIRQSLAIVFALARTHRIQFRLLARRPG